MGCLSSKAQEPVIWTNVPIKKTSTPPPTPLPSEHVDTTPEPTPLPSEHADTTPEPTPSSTSSDDLGKTSDFECFVIQFENDSDEIKIPSSEDDYPAPSATITKGKAENIKWFDDWDPDTASDEIDTNIQNEAMTKAELDNHAKQTPTSVLNSFKDLISYLKTASRGHPSREEEVLVRAILVWLSHQEVEQFINHEGTRDTPIGFLSLLGQKRSTYSTFFTLLCREAGIKCTQVHGICKAGDYQPGDRTTDNLTCLWNTVFVNNSWQIIHPYWVCRSVFGKRSGGWIKLEESGKTIGKRQTEAPGVVKNAFKEYYIMPNPAEFIYRCHPDDEKWQLVSNPISREMFLDQGYLLPPLWGMGIKMTSENKCSLRAIEGTTTITFETPKAIANELNLDYEFLLKENTATKDIENEMLRPENMPRLVAKIRNSTEWAFHIQFPVQGTYRIVIYGSPDRQSMLRLCEFEIKCSKSKQNCRLTPFNPGILGFGPGPKSEAAGLFLPSHRNGLVTTEIDKPTSLNFLLDKDMSKSLSVNTKLFDSNSNDCSSLLQCKIVSQEIKITIKVSKEGDYGLRIITGTKHTIDKDADTSSDETMTIVCNYLITTSSKLMKEKANKRIARRNLLSAIENGEKDEIKKTIGRCIKEKIAETDLDIENARRKLDVLEFKKDIHDAYLRRHVITTENTIQKLKKSMYERMFRESIRHLESLVVELTDEG